MEIHSNQFLALALSPAGGAPAAAPAPADGAEAARFRGLVNGDTATVGPVADGQAAATLIAAPQAAAGQPVNLGDAILRGIDGIRENFRTAWDTVTAFGGPDSPPVGPQELFQFQLKVVETSFQYEMIGKVVSKAEQNVEQVVKMQ
jgi:type III secretion system YscI/HrpB-like protein